jgi:YidC/Oxa1 family membrane protein insertase
MGLILGYQVLYYMPRMKRAEEARRAKLATEQLEKQAAEEKAPARQALESTRADSLRTPADSTAATAGAEASLGGFPVIDPQTVRRITIRTPLYDITMTTAGAEIVSARLAKYKTKGETIELIAQDDSPDLGGVGEVVLLGDDRTLPLSQIAFEAFTEGSTAPLENGAVVSLDPGAAGSTVSFRATGPDGVPLERSYVFDPASYVIRSGVRFGSAGLPFVRSIRWGFGPGLRPTEANVIEDLAALRASLRLGEEYHRKRRGDFDETFTGTVDWVALQVKYFTVAMLSPAPMGGAARLQGRKADGFMTASMDLPASERQGRVEQTVELYVGPINYDALKALGRGLDKNVEMGNKYTRPVSWAVLWGLLKLHTVIPNYGIVIILLSIFTKVLFYRLTHKSFKSMRDMQALQPRLQVLKEKYKNDRQKLSQETMKLYKESGVNPLGGCLPMLLQMPIFISLFNVLRNTIELRQAPFVGWMNDLSQQDVLARLPFSLPFLGNAVSVLPFIMGASMLVQSKLGGSIAGPESSPTQSKALMYMMPIMFTVLFYRMPSGLVLYWIVNTVLSVWQQYYINKGAEKDERAKAEAVNKA